MIISRGNHCTKLLTIYASSQHQILSTANIPLCNDFETEYNLQPLHHGKKWLPADSTPIEKRDLNVLVVTGESPQSTRKLLVSSKVLALASPVFATLFSRRFSERNKIIKSIRPEIMLNDDYSDAMRIILGVFHFRELEKVDVQMLAEIAVLYDKYDCTKAHMPWMKIWSERTIASIKIATAHGYNFLLAAAHFFRDQELFSQESLEILRGCTTQ